MWVNLYIDLLKTRVDKCLVYDFAGALFLAAFEAKGIEN